MGAQSKAEQSKESAGGKESKVADQLAALEHKFKEGEKVNTVWVKGAQADTIFGLVILLNAAFIGIDLEVSDPNATGVNWTLWFFETAFLVVFLIEISLRVRAEMPQPMKFFCSGWGAFDTSVTVLGCVDTWIFTPMAGAGGNPLSSFTVLRVFRLMRLVRLVRVLRMFSELVVLIQTLADSIKAVAWMSLLLGMILYTGSVVCVLLLGQPYGEDDEDVDLWFGNLPRAMYAHFMVVTLENWPDISMASMTYSPVWSLYWIFMIVLTNFALVNLMIGVIVERIISNSQEQETQMSSFLDESEQFKSTLMTLFQAADVDSSGDITRAEVRSLLSKRETHEIMAAFGINLNLPPKTLHTLMDLDREGETSFEEFFDSAIRLSGSKHNLHSLFVQHDVCYCHQQLATQVELLEAKIDKWPLPQKALPQAPGAPGDRTNLSAATGSNSPTATRAKAPSGGDVEHQHTSAQPEFYVSAHHQAPPPHQHDSASESAAVAHQRTEVTETIQEITKRMLDFEVGQTKLLTGLEDLKKDMKKQAEREQALIAASKLNNASNADGTNSALPSGLGKHIDSCTSIFACQSNTLSVAKPGLPPRNH